MGYKLLWIGLTLIVASPIVFPRADSLPYIGGIMMFIGSVVILFSV